MSIKLDRFGGLAPKISPHILADNMATAAVNVRLDSGSLNPIKGPTTATTIPNTSRSITQYNGAWLYWTAANVDAVLSPVPNDAWDRLYYTGDGYPKYTFQGRPASGSANGLKLGVPAPGNAPSLGKSGTPSGDSSLRYYVYTYVTPQGEEGPPSPAASISVTATETVNMTFSADDLSTYNLGTGSFRRIYRTVTGVGGTAYLYVKDEAIGNLTAADDLLDTALGEEITSTYWFPPPADMVGLRAMANGFLVGFSGNALCVSERLLPHAWNPDNQLAFPGDITALAVSGDSIIVFTEKMPYLVTGTNPESLSAIEIEHPQTCLSRASIVNMDGYILAASPDGLIAAVANDLNIATDAFLSKEQWSAYSPGTLRGFYYEGIYLGFSDTKAFMFDTRGGESRLTELSGLSFLAGYYDAANDKLYLLDADGNIQSWETGSAQAFTWKSKPLRLPAPICPAALRIHADDDVTFKLYADGVLVNTQTVSDSGVKRLPSGYKAREFQVELSASAVVESFAIGTSVRELT